MQIRSHFSRLNIMHEINLFLSAGQPLPLQPRNETNKLCPISEAHSTVSILMLAPGSASNLAAWPRHTNIMDTQADGLQN